MADHSAIEWTDATWNPIRARNKKTGKLGWHCEHATTGCEFCYAEGFNRRLGTGLAFKPGHRADIEIFLDEEMLTLPLRWKKPRMIFVCSMTDLFADFVPDEFIDKMFAVMALAPQHTFQVLTKRAARMRDYMNEQWQGTPAIKIGDWGIPAGAPTGRRSQIEEACELFLEKLNLVDTTNDALWTPEGGCKAMQWSWPLPNVWLGVSAERQQEADERIRALLDTPAAIRFISAEPLLGPINLTKLCILPQKPGSVRAGIHLNALKGQYCESGVAYKGDWDVNGPSPPLSERRKLDWVIVGGESAGNGRPARPMHPQWARSLRDQSQAAGVAFFFKQWGGWQPRYYMSPPDANGHSEHLLDLNQTPSSIILHASEPKQFPVNMIRMPKKEAGRELDGELHNAMPAVRG